MASITPWGTRATTMVHRQRVTTSVITLVFPNRRALQMPAASLSPGRKFPAPIPRRTQPLQIPAQGYSRPRRLLSGMAQVIRNPCFCCPLCTARSSLTQHTRSGIAHCGPRELVKLYTRRIVTRLGATPHSAKQLGEAADCRSCRDQSEVRREGTSRRTTQMSIAHRGW